MKSLGMKRLAGLALAGLIVGGSLAAPAFAQDTAAPAAAAPAAAAPAATPAPEAPATAAAAPAPAAPGEIAAPKQTVDKGDTTWMLVSSVLVLLMIVPGLALFYGGLVRTKNMLSMLMQTTTVCVIGMMAWLLWGYSLAFTDGGGHDTFLGGFSRLWMMGASPSTTVATFSTGVYLPEFVYVCFQMTFACITACLVLGGLAERFKFSACVIFAVLWPLLSYYPIAHMVWWWPGPDAIATHPKDPAHGGLLWGWGALDFAGGTVVHINAGVAALMGALIMGPRKGFMKEPMQPHSLTLTLVGAGAINRS